MRHDLVPVAAYFVGRALVADGRIFRRLGTLVVVAAAAVVAVGIVEDYLVPIGWWRDSSVPRYFRDQLGFHYHGTGNADPTPALPENFIFNLGTDSHFLRRLVSTFLSPLAASYALVAGLLVLAAASWRRPALLAVAVLLYAGLLLTDTRSAILVLPVALVLLALLLHRPRLAGSSLPPSSRRPAGRTSTRTSRRRGTGRRPTSCASTPPRPVPGRRARRRARPPAAGSPRCAATGRASRAASARWSTTRRATGSGTRVLRLRGTASR